MFWLSRCFFFILKSLARSIDDRHDLRFLGAQFASGFFAIVLGIEILADIAIVFKILQCRDETTDDDIFFQTGETIDFSRR